MKLELTQSEIAAVIDLIYQHVRTSPTGKGYAVWRKMFEFQGEDKPISRRQENRREQQPSLI